MNTVVDHEKLAVLARRLSTICALVEQEYVDPIPDIISFRLHGHVDVEQLDMIVASTLFLDPVTRIGGPQGWEVFFINWNSYRAPSVVCVEQLHQGFWKYTVKEAI